jgi:hypothetical protein
MDRTFCNEEVDSSILSGSTICPDGRRPYPRISAGSQVASPGTAISSIANRIMITA